jgi:hypothetical protein
MAGNANRFVAWPVACDCYVEQEAQAEIRAATTGFVLDRRFRRDVRESPKGRMISARQYLPAQTD